MMIDEYGSHTKASAMSEEKEIKVKIPLEYHIKLHTVKVLRGQNISQTVKEALERYFEEAKVSGWEGALSSVETTHPR